MIALGLDDPARNLLGAPFLIDVSGVDEIDAVVGGMVDDALGFGLSGLSAEHHGAKAELGYLEPAATENACFYLCHAHTLSAHYCLDHDRDGALGKT